MPVQYGGKSYGSGGGATGEAGDRLPMLEREMGKLRREIESLKKGSGGAVQSGLSNWMTTAMAAVGVLLGLMALLRH